MFLEMVSKNMFWKQYYISSILIILGTYTKTMYFRPNLLDILSLIAYGTLVSRIERCPFLFLDNPLIHKIFILFDTSCILNAYYNDQLKETLYFTYSICLCTGSTSNKNTFFHITQSSPYCTV